jgi:hypothetical protein
MATMKPKLSPAQIKALSSHLGGKPMGRPMPPMKSAMPSMTPPGMDAEDLIDGGADEATEKK